MKKIITYHWDIYDIIQRTETELRAGENIDKHQYNLREVIDICKTLAKDYEDEIKGKFKEEKNGNKKLNNNKT